MAEKTPSLLRVLMRVPEFLSRLFLTLSLLFAPALSLGLFPIFRAYGTQIAVDALTVGRATEFKRGAGILAAVVLTNRLLNFLYTKKGEDTIQEFAARQRELLVKSALEMPLDQYESLARGDLVSGATGDIGWTPSLNA